MSTYSRELKCILAKQCLSAVSSRLLAKQHSISSRQIRYIALDNVLVWFQDEVRFGKRNTTTRVWTEKGTKPRAIQPQQFEYDYFFGTVCINTGENEAIASPFSNMEAMRGHLNLISAATPTGETQSSYG